MSSKQKGPELQSTENTNTNSMFFLFQGLNFQYNFIKKHNKNDVGIRSSILFDFLRILNVFWTDFGPKIVQKGLKKRLK